MHGARRLVLAVLITAVLLLMWNGSTFFQQHADRRRRVQPRNPARKHRADPQCRAHPVPAGGAMSTSSTRPSSGPSRSAGRRSLQAPTRSPASITARAFPIAPTSLRRGRARGRQKAGRWCRSMSTASRRSTTSTAIEIGDKLLRNIAALLREDAWRAGLHRPARRRRVRGRLADRARRPCADRRAGRKDDAFDHPAVHVRRAHRPGRRLRRDRLGRCRKRTCRPASPRRHRHGPGAQRPRLSRPMWFDAGMERALIAHGEVEQGIRFGLEQAQFVPYFEPQVDLATGEIIGFEVLPRWNHPLSGLIAPDDVHSGGRGFRADRPPVRAGHRRRACTPRPAGTRRSASRSTSRRRSWPTAGLPSASSRSSPKPASRPSGWWSRSAKPRCSPTWISRARSSPASRTRASASRSTISAPAFPRSRHLRSLPFDIIKIDRSFVANLSEKRESAAIVRAVTTLANALVGAGVHRGHRE